MNFAVHAHTGRIKMTEVCGMDWRLSEKEKSKYEAVMRLGLRSRLLENGWPGLTAKESGRVGAEMRRRLKNQE